jgi:hypothetical protein
MKRPRASNTRPLWNAIVIISIVVVIGFAVAGYEIHHLQSEISGLQSQVKSLQGGQSYLANLIKVLSLTGK